MVSARVPACLLIIVATVSAQRAGRPDAGPKDQANPAGYSQQVVDEGKLLYNKSCTMCHGLDGTAGDRAPALAARRRYLRSTNKQLFDAIRSGIPGTPMPAFTLPEEDVWKIVAYIRSLRATAVDEFVPGDITRGEALFSGKGGCSECHMIRGRGGLLGPDLSNIGAERSLKSIRASLTDPQSAITKGFQPVKIVTGSGAVIQGVVKNEDSFSMQVMDRSGDVHLLLRSELKDVAYADKSLMPRNYDQRLTKEEMQDVLAYLSRQARVRVSRTQTSRSDTYR